MPPSARCPYQYRQVPGFTQLLVNTDGTLGVISPFRIPATITDAMGKTGPIYPADIASVNHSHTGIARKIALDANGVAQNTEYALTEEGGAFGSALMAGVGAGHWANLDEACGQAIEVAQRIEPEAADLAAYKTGYAKWRKLYPAL